MCRQCVDRCVDALGESAAACGKPSMPGKKLNSAVTKSGKERKADWYLDKLKADPDYNANRAAAARWAG